MFAIKPDTVGIVSLTPYNLLSFEQKSCLNNSKVQSFEDISDKTLPFRPEKCSFTRKLNVQS